MSGWTRYARVVCRSGDMPDLVSHLSGFERTLNSQCSGERPLLLGGVQARLSGMQPCAPTSVPPPWVGNQIPVRGDHAQ